MWKALYILGLVHACFNTCFGQSTFNKIYYGVPMTNGGARANVVIQTSDSAFFVAGATKNADVMYVIKTNIAGDTSWTLAYDLGPGAGADIIYTAIETSDNSYIIGGLTRDILQPNSDAFLIKLKPNGDTAWVRKIGLTNRSERCYSVKQTSDGGFIFCGIRYNVNGSNAITDSDVYLVKTDSAGYPQWEKTFGGTDYEFGNSIEFTSEGGYMILGAQYSNNTTTSNTYLIKTDSLGNMIWQKTYGGAWENYGSSIVKTKDDAYALAGYTYISTDTIAAYILKVDSAGTVQWEKRYKGNFTSTEFNAVKELPTGELIVCGDLQGDSLNYRYYGITKKLDANGNAIWEKQYQYFNADTTQHYFYAMDLCNDGGFVMAGMTIDLRYGVSPRNAMWLVKTDAYGCDSVSCLTTSINSIELPKKTELLIYPNPFSETAIVEYSITQENSKSTLFLSDAYGKEIKKYSITENDKGKLTIDASELNSGVYYLRIVSDKKIAGVLKLMIVK